MTKRSLAVTVTPGLLASWAPPRAGHALILRAAPDIDGTAYLLYKRESKCAEVRVARVRHAGGVVSAIDWRTGREVELLLQDRGQIEARVRAEIATRSAEGDR
jgi:hypothetical protein